MLVASPTHSSATTSRAHAEEDEAPVRRLRLPKPEGTVRVAFAGGTSDARLQRPGGVPAALRVRGGVSHLRFDGRRVESVGGDAQLRSDDFAGAVDRYDLDLAGGASHITIAEG